MNRACVVALLLAAPSFGCFGAESPEGTEPPEHVGTDDAALFGGSPVRSCEWTNLVMLGSRCSGVLLHSELVVYAAHCGEDFKAVRLGSQEAPTRYCRSFPGATLGGTDVAYCRLESRLLADLVPPLTGCEETALTPGAPVVLAGYGADSKDGQSGIRRTAPGAIVEINENEIVVGGPGAGICPGDSGGPLLILVRERDGAESYRVAGIASASPAGACRESPSHYARLSPYLAWLEQDSGLDLTPCGDTDGNWSPTPRCVAPRPTSEPCEERARWDWSGSCGTPFSPTEMDQWPPTIEVRAPEPGSRFTLGDGPVEISVRIEAADEGWGLDEVGVELIHGDDDLRWRNQRSLPPFDFEPVMISEPGRYEVRAAAQDRSGQIAVSSATFDVDSDETGETGCSAARLGVRSMPGVGVPGLLLTAIVAYARRRNGQTCSNRVG